jgi:hypothetical protein
MVKHPFVIGAGGPEAAPAVIALTGNSSPAA